MSWSQANATVVEQPEFATGSPQYLGANPPSRVFLGTWVIVRFIDRYGREFQPDLLEGETVESLLSSSTSELQRLAAQELDADLPSEE